MCEVSVQSRPVDSDHAVLGNQSQFVDLCRLLDDNLKCAHTYICTRVHVCVMYAHTCIAGMAVYVRTA